MPGKKGRWNLDEIEKWRNATFRTIPAHTRGGDSALGDDEGDDTATAEVQRAKTERLIADARRAKAEAELKELQLREKMENLVYMEDVERFYSTFISSMQELLEEACADMEPLFPESDRERLVEELRERQRMALSANADPLRELRTAGQ